VQSLLLRRTVVGVTTDRLVARLCRAAAVSSDALVHAIARITRRTNAPVSASSTRHFRTRLCAEASGGRHRLPGIDLEHVAPAAPSDDWSPDGIRRWADLSDDEQNSFRALAPRSAT
jgi:hypothetical protein